MINILYVTLVDVTKPTGPGTNELESILALDSCHDDHIQVYFLLPYVSRQSHGNPKSTIYFNVKETVVKGFSLVVWQLQYLMDFIRIVRQFERKNLFVIIRPEPMGRLNLIPLWLQMKGVAFGFRHVQDQLELSSFRNLKRWYINKLLKWSFKKAQYLDTTQVECRDALRHSGFDDVQIIGNAVNLNRFQLCDKVESKIEVGISPNKFVVGYIGGVPLERGAKQMIASARELIKSIPDIHFLVVGDSKFKNGSQLSNMKDLAVQEGVTEYFTFTGTVPYSKVLSYFNSLDVGIALVSSEEVLRKGNSSQKIYQYLSCGVPVIVPKYTHDDLVQQKVALQIVPEQQHDMYEAILYFYNNRIERNYIRKVAENYSVEKRAQTQIMLWKQAAKK